ncbi:MAG: beta-propeller fold lactonase family protein [Saprospiraceae bacterium]
MKINLYLPVSLLVLCCYLSCSPSIFAQLHFEGLHYNGQGNALLNSPTAMTLSPEGKFLYLTSETDDAVSIYRKNIDGSLSFINAVKNETNAISGIGGAQGLVVSPDGKHLYVAGAKDQAIGIFKREIIEGEIEYLGLVQNGMNGVEGLIDPQRLAMSSDGNYLYATSSSSDALLVFSRNVLSGALFFIEKKQDGFGNIDGLSGPLEVQVSPDDRHVYVTAKEDGAICLFERNSLTGQLNFITAFQEGSIATPGTLSDAHALAISPNGDFVYATSAEQGTLLAFERNATTGLLTFKDVVLDDLGAVDGLAYAAAVTISSDGKFVYALGAEENAIAVFSWNEMTAAFDFLMKIEEGTNGIEGLVNPTSMQLSLTGAYLYVTAKTSGKVLVFARNKDTGELIFKTSIKSDGDGVKAMEYPVAMDVSPDGNFLYVANQEGNSLSVFQRNNLDGSLIFIQEIIDVNGLEKVAAVVSSPDGNYMYAAGSGADAIVVFQRNAITGRLSYEQMIENNVGLVNGLAGIKSLSLSPDGTTLYAAGFWDNSIVAFARTITTGALNFLARYEDGISGVDGLALINQVIVSADGEYVYSISFLDDAISIFKRDAATGALLFQQIVKDGFGGVDGLDGGEALYLSPDGMQLYGLGFFDQALAQFDRDPVTGNLTFAKVYKNGMPNLVGLGGVQAVAGSPDGNFIYLGNILDDGVAAYVRQAETGDLTFEKIVYDGQAGVNGIARPEAITLSPDGRYIYVCGGADNAIAHFSCSASLVLHETICAGATFSYGNINYDTTGNYLDTIENGACRTFLDLNLKVLPANVELSKTICLGDTFVLGNESYQSAGSYSKVLTNSLGCDSTVLLNLLVEEFLEENLVITICAGENFSVGTTSYNETGMYTTTLTSSFGCDSLVNLDLTVLPPVVVPVAATICANEFFVMGAKNYTTSGNYQASFTAANGCDSLVNLSLTVLGTSTGNINATICESESYAIGNMNFQTAGLHLVSLSNAAGCDSIIKLSLTVLPAPEIITEATICSGTTYWWEGTAYTETGIYQESYPTGNGCFGMRTLKLTVQEAYYEKEVTLCAGDSYNFAGLSLVENGVYTNLFNSTQGCDSLVVLYFSVIPAMAERVVTICAGDTYLLGNENYTATGSYLTTINTELGCEQEVSLALTVVESLTQTIDTTICAGERYWVGTTAYETTGNYVDTLSSDFGCDSIVSLSLTVLAPLVINETIKLPSENEAGEIELEVLGGSPPYNFSWSNAVTTQNIDNLVAGLYTVSITDQANCQLSQSFLVDDLVGLNVLDPAITFVLYPNPVIKNDFIYLRFPQKIEEKLSLQIINSIGQLVPNTRTQVSVGTTQQKVNSPTQTGIYWLQLIDEKGNKTTQKIIVQ